MKTKNTFHLLAALVTVALLGICAELSIPSASALEVNLINGTLYTNATQVIGSTTNQIGVVAAASTNTLGCLRMANHCRGVRGEH